MVSYEVTVMVPAKAMERFETYMLDKHIAEVVATGYFAGATFYRDGERRRTVYEAYDREALDNYLANDAERLRGDFTENFPDGVVATREIWDAVMRFDAP
jgi:predicted AlkP superfamily phosphohydrolase/phosphomutase